MGDQRLVARTNFTNTIAATTLARSTTAAIRAVNTASMLVSVSASRRGSD